MKLTIIGGGSVRTPRLIPSLVKRTAALNLAEVWLMDLDGAKLDLMGGLCQALAEQLGATFKIIRTTDARAAIRDADAVITSIRPGKEQGRATDERIAMRHGVLGQETTGAAGFAMAMRSIPAILDYARMVEEIAAPGAWVYNFTNPAGLVAQGLTYAGIKRVVGICDSANGAQHAVSRYLNVPMRRVRHSVYGLNHLSWTQSVRVDPEADGTGEEVLPALLNDARFIQSTHMSMFDPGIVQWEQAYLNEYLHYFYHRDEVLKALIAKTETRGEETLRLTNEMLANLAQTHSTDEALQAWQTGMGKRGATYMAHARHGQERVHTEPVGDDEEGYAAVALGCIQAISTGDTIYTGLNVPNRGAIPQMRDDDVVEITCSVNADSITPLPVVGTIHDDQLMLMQSVKLYERLGSQAILQKSRELAIEALTVHPLIGSYPLARTLIDEFLAAHRDLVGEWR